MLDRIAITAVPLRIACAALLMLLIVRVDFFASAITWQVRGELAASAIRCTHAQSVMRTRAPGLRRHYMQRHYMMRGDVGGHRLHRLDQ